MPPMMLLLPDDRIYAACGASCKGQTMREQREPIAFWGTADASNRLAPAPLSRSLCLSPCVCVFVLMLFLSFLMLPAWPHAAPLRRLRSNFGGVSITIHCHLPFGGGFSIYKLLFQALVAVHT